MWIITLIIGFIIGFVLKAMLELGQDYDEEVEDWEEW